MSGRRVLAYCFAALVFAGSGAQGLAQPAPPTDKLPPGMNKPVAPAPGKPAVPPRPLPPRPPVRPLPPRPEPGRPLPGRPLPPRPVPARPLPPRPLPPGPARPGYARPGPIINHRATQRFRLGEYRRPPGYFVRSWSTGVVLPPLFRVRDYWLTQPDIYGLRAPPPGTEWVRVDADALLVSDDTGEILDIVYGIFY